MPNKPKSPKRPVFLGLILLVTEIFSLPTSIKPTAQNPTSHPQPILIAQQSQLSMDLVEWLKMVIELLATNPDLQNIVKSLTAIYVLLQGMDGYLKGKKNKSAIKKFESVRGNYTTCLMANPSIMRFLEREDLPKPKENSSAFFNLFSRGRKISDSEILKEGKKEFDSCVKKLKTEIRDWFNLHGSEFPPEKVVLIKNFLEKTSDLNTNPNQIGLELVEILSNLKQLQEG